MVSPGCRDVRRVVRLAALAGERRRERGDWPLGRSLLRSSRRGRGGCWRAGGARRRRLSALLKYAGIPSGLRSSPGSGSMLGGLGLSSSVSLSFAATPDSCFGGAIGADFYSSTCTRFVPFTRNFSHLLMHTLEGVRAEIRNLLCKRNKLEFR